MGMAMPRDLSGSSSRLNFQLTEREALHCLATDIVEPLRETPADTSPPPKQQTRQYPERSSNPLRVKTLISILP